ncbi:MAG: Rrf2 family transcriptional regulator, partial [Thermoanaerobaculia bacterium]
EHFAATDSQMLRILRRLEDAQLVKEIGGDWTGFVPGCDPDRITVEEVVMHMEGGQRALPEVVTEDAERAAVAAIFTRLNESTSGALNRMTIGHLVRQLYSPRAPARIDERVKL